MGAIAGGLATEMAKIGGLVVNLLACNSQSTN